MKKERAFQILPLIPGTIWFFVFLILPLLTIFVFSFCERGDFGQVELTLTADNYMRIFDSLMVRPLIRSLCLAVANTLICLVIAIPISFFIALQPKKRRNIFLLLVILPFWSNFLVRTYAWIVLLKEGGLINQALLSLGVITQSVEILFTWKAVLIGLVYVYLPFMILPVYASVEKLDLRFIKTAADLGATSVQIFFYVITPLIRPGLRTGALFVSVMTFGDFVLADLLGGAKVSLMGNVIKNQYLVARDWSFGSALTITFLISAVILTKVILSFSFPKLPQEQR